MQLTTVNRNLQYKFSNTADHC